MGLGEDLGRILVREGGRPVRFACILMFPVALRLASILNVPAPATVSTWVRMAINLSSYWVAEKKASAKRYRTGKETLERI